MQSPSKADKTIYAPSNKKSSPRGTSILRERTGMGGRAAAALIIFVIAVVLGAAILVLSPSQSTATTTSSISLSRVNSSTSDISEVTSSSTSPTPPVYQVVASNLTLQGPTAAIPCNFIWPFGDSACPSASNATLSGVELVKYGVVYYYSLQNQSAATGYGQGPCPNNCVHYPYDIWFTNSTVFCVSYAIPLGYKCPSLPYDEETISIPRGLNSSTDSANGLRLSLDLWTNSTGALDLKVSEFNTLDEVNNVTMGGDFPPIRNTWTGSACSSSPIGYEIVEGNYGASIFTQATALSLGIQSPVQCAEVMGGSGVISFKPLSDGASLSLASSGFWMGSFEAYSGSTCSNLSPSPGCQLSFVTFPPGPYTVVAGDEWGDVVILHFTIQS